jgi:hypothetical protein
MILAGGLLPLDLDSLDARVRGPAIAPTYDPLHSSAWTFEHCLNPPIVEVAHPSLDTTSARMLTGVGAKIDPLYATIDQDMRSDSLHGSDPFITLCRRFHFMLGHLL